METAQGGLSGVHALVWAVAGLGVLLLVIDHWAHVLGVLPYLVILACPLMHLFLHRGHGHDGHGNRRADQPPKAH